MLPRIATLLLALALASPALADIVDSKTERQLFLPSAKFKVIIPRDDWAVTREQTRTDGQSVYYALASAKRELTLWIFIDQTPVCQSGTACLELALKNKAYSDAKDMKFSEHDSFKVVQFSLDPGQGAAKQQHLIAAAYVDGCWVDIHLIAPAKDGADPVALVAFLKQLVIK